MGSLKNVRQCHESMCIHSMCFLSKELMEVLVRNMVPSVNHDLFHQLRSPSCGFQGYHCHKIILVKNW